MRYAIVSDIHANAQAWAAVRQDIAALGADRILCLGDVVGYGPAPAEVLESVYAHVHHVVLGNHDAALCGRMGTQHFSGDARAIVDWTASRLSRGARTLIKTWPLTLRGPGFRCGHGDLGDPPAFHYVIDPDDARPSWERTSERILFVGHAHTPGIFLLGPSGIPRRVAPQDFVVEPDRRYLISVGSVGQPRDGDPRAAYCLFDAEAGELFWRRVPFDLDAYREAVARSGRPGSPDSFLEADPLRGVPPLRPQLSFHPPEAEGDGARGAEQVRDVAELKQRVRRWKGVTFGLLGALLLAAAGLGWAAYRRATRGVEIALPRAVPPRAAEYPVDRPMVALPAQSVRPGSGIPDWTIRLGDRRRQSVALTPDPEWGPVLRLVSRGTAAPVRLLSTPVEVEPGLRLTAEALFRKSDAFKGQVSLAVSVVRDGEAGEETLDHFVVKEPNLRRRGGWWAARETVTLPAGARFVRLEIRGTFEGEAEVHGLELRRR